MHRLDTAIDRFFRLLPAGVLFSAFFALDGGLRWIGLLGVVPLILATRRSCPSCALRRAPAAHGFQPWAGH